MHSVLSMRHQPYHTSSYTSVVAETASTFNEVLLLKHLQKTAKTDDERLYLTAELAEKIRRTIYRQALFADFELQVHTAAEQGTPLTSEFLNKTYADLIKHYYGPAYTVGPNDDIEWAYVPHFYYKYYMYSYAAGLSAGIALAEKVVNEGAPARDAYLNMLKGGNSKPPLALFKDAGVDLSTPAPFTAAARLLDDTVAELEKLFAAREAKAKAATPAKGAKK
jgi:oligoendopeptidase F